MSFSVLKVLVLFLLGLFWLYTKDIWGANNVNELSLFYNGMIDTLGLHQIICSILTLLIAQKFFTNWYESQIFVNLTVRGGEIFSQ